MDKSEEIQYLKEQLAETSRLAGLRYDSQDYPSWRRKFEGFLEAEFGHDSSEYQSFIKLGQRSRAHGIDIGGRVQQEDYTANLEDISKFIRSIIRKLEKLGIETKPDKGIEFPKTLVSNNGEKRPFDKAKEIEIQGDNLEKLYPIITMVAAELRFKNHFYEARLANSNVTDNFAGFAVSTIDPTTMSKTPVGAFTLLLLGSNRIMLRVAPRSRWHHDFGLTPQEIIKLGLIANDENDRKFYDELFNQFINSLEDRLTHYGLEITLFKRLWRWIKSNKILSIIIVAITLIAAIITIWGFASGFFS